MDTNTGIMMMLGVAIVGTLVAQRWLKCLTGQEPPTVGLERPDPAPAPCLIQIRLYSGGRLIQVGRAEINTSFVYGEKGFVKYVEMVTGETVTGRGDYVIEYVARDSARPVCEMEGWTRASNY